MTASLSMRVCTGANAGTESASAPGIAFMDIDSAAIDPDANEVAPGSNSFEKWVRLALDDADGQAVSGFWIERSGDLPDGVTVKLGTTDTPTTPTAAASTVARETMAAGRHYFFDAGAYDEDGARTRYLVLQEIVAADAPSGAIDTQGFTFGWTSALA